MKQYFEYTDFNDIEDSIDSLTTELKLVNELLPNFTKKVWVLNDYPYIQQVFRIEEAIYNFNKYIVSLPKYVYKQWLLSATSIDYKNFKWSNYQNWLNGINQMQEYKNKIEIRYCGEGYSGDGIWL